MVSFNWDSDNIKTHLHTNMNQVNFDLTHNHIADLLKPERGVAVITPSGDIKGLLQTLLDDTRQFDFTQSLQTTSTGVVQNFKAFGEFEPTSVWFKLTDQISKSLQEDFDRLGYAHLFQTPLDLHDPTLQFYPQSKPEDQFALSPHRDQSGFVNLVVVMLIKGPSSFFICKDRDGTTPIEPVAIEAKPGDITVMRAGNFGYRLAKKLLRPCHFVSRIEDPQGRLSLAFRQLSSDKARVQKLECFFGKKFTQGNPEAAHKK